MLCMNKISNKISHTIYYTEVSTASFSENTNQYSTFTTLKCILKSTIL